MRIVNIRQHSGERCHFRSPLHTRMGDLCAQRLMISEWRFENPDSHLIVSFDASHHQHAISSQLPTEWVFGEFADEVWVRETVVDVWPDFKARPILEIYNSDSGIIPWPDRNERDPAKQVHEFKHPSFDKMMIHMWAAWRHYMYNRKTNPVATLPQDVLDKMSAYLDSIKVPRPFVAVQPLYDARYHTYRNAPQRWWEIFIDTLGCQIPVVVVGGTQWLKDTNFRTPHAYPLHRKLENPLESLAVVSMAKCFAGGETGFPLWASMLNVPVGNVVPSWGRGRDGKGRLDYRPIAFGAPVVYIPMMHGPTQANRILKDMFDGKITESTPV